MSQSWMLVDDTYQPITYSYPSIAFPADAWKKFGGPGVHTFVFLDIDDASVLKDCSGISQKLRKVLEKEGYDVGSLGIHGYVDEGTLSDKNLKQCWEDSQILMTVVDKGDVNGRFEWMFIHILRRLSLLRRQHDNALRNMLILSKDMTSSIEDLRGEYLNINIGISDLATYLNQVEDKVEVEEDKVCSVHYHNHFEDEVEDENEARLDKLFSRLFSEKEEMHIHMVGLDGSGKTTILHNLKLPQMFTLSPTELPEMFTLSPTVGFSVEIGAYKNISFPTWDVRGQHNMRTLGSDCFQDIRGLIFVVDSNDRDRVVEARDKLHSMLKEDEWRDAVLLVFANKQDLPNAMNADELTDKLKLDSLGQRHWYIQSTCATSGGGLDVGLDWLSNKIANMAESKSQAATDEPTSDVAMDEVEVEEDKIEDENKARLDKLFSRLFAKKKMMHILMSGLDGSGKTSIFHKLKLGEIWTYNTSGFCVETVEYKNISFTVWDVGGQHNIRTFLRDPFVKTEGLIFVVDSSDRDRVVEARDELHKMLKLDELRDVVLLVFANKQDLPNAMNVAELTDKLELHSLGQRRHGHIRSTCTTSGEGLDEGLDWLSYNIANKEIDLPIISHEEGNIGVFWNMNDYPVASEDPETICTSIKQFLEGEDFKGEVSIKAYVDDDKLSPELLEKYKRARIDIKTFGNRGEGGKTRLVLTDVYWWTMHNHAPANVFLLSKDAELIPDFEVLYQQGYGVFVSDAEPTKDHPRLYLPCACQDWLLSDVPRERKLDAVSF